MLVLLSADSVEPRCGLRTNSNRKLLAGTFLAPLLGLLFVACGTDTASGTAAAVTATALRREEAIASFTAEAVAAGPIATRFPVRTPVPETPQAVAGTPTPLLPDASLIPTPEPDTSPTPDPITQQREIDRQALETLLGTRARALGSGDFEAWYETCSSTIRESAIENDALGRQLRAIRFEPDETLQVEFVVEQVLFSGDTAATVLWGLRVGTQYFAGFGGGPYAREDGAWYSLGWGCAG